jgi:hypothetical protein
LRALKLKALLAMTNATGQKAQADDAVTNDHDCRKNGVARQPGGVGPTGNHHGDDERNFNNGDSQGKHECPEWLTDTMRDDFGMVNCRKNGGEQCEGFSCDEWKTGSKDCVDT